MPLKRFRGGETFGFELATWGIRIEDSGSGMSGETLNQIFVPFFTTKKVGEGTGLGLSIAYGLIQKHNGKIDVKSELGKGTVFTITLPVSQKLDKAG